ncbi:MAG: YihY/virulence factor BrkB family protein [Candidatus Cloacimonadota bacterium]|nr:YihY/virulence factor BrkB family protein [Candidatus Cloacimonadota bacterium]
MNKPKYHFKKFRQSLKQIYSNFASDQCFLRASSLSYITFLGFIPFVMVIFLFTPDITVVKIREAIIGFIFKTFMPSSAETMRTVFNQLLERRVGLDVIGLILLLVTSFFLFKSIANTFDKILKVYHKRNGSLLRDFERFVAAIIGGLVVVAALLFTTSAPVISKVANLAVFIKITPYFGIYLLLFVIYKFVTSVHPKTIHALIGAAFTSIIWIILKFGFDWYIITFTNVRSVYGTLGSFPIFMIWLYFNWVVILFGMEIVSYYSGFKPIKESGKEHKNKVTFKLTIEQGINDKISKELKEVKFSEANINKANLLKLIKKLIDFRGTDNKNKEESNELPKK